MKLACVILAAGQGKRMKSALPKVLHRICGLPMLQYVVDAASGLRPEHLIVVVGSHVEMINREVAAPGLKVAIQKEPKGTGDALKCALPFLKDFRGTLLVLNGDSPLVSVSTVKKFLSRHGRKGNAVSLLSFIADEPYGYGRIIRDEKGGVSAIVEERDASSSQKKIKEVNSGLYAINHEVLNLLGRVKINRRKGEYYLTDIAALAIKSGLGCSSFAIGLEDEFMGVNTREELLRASEYMRQRIISGLIEDGVNFIDPASAFIHPYVSIGRDTTLYPNVYIEGTTKIGRETVIYPNVRISESIVGDGVVIKDSTVIERSKIRSGASIGPFAHIRPESEIGQNAKIGNFVELKKTAMGAGSKASHLSYIGDSTIGRGVNIGAGTITCNYDGREKHRTIIEDNVFIGSDSQLVAPVRIGRGAYIGAGSTITKDVPSDALGVSRSEQRVLKGWAKKMRNRAERKK